MYSLPLIELPLIVGNWKMHKTGAEAQSFIQALPGRAWLAVPFTALSDASRAAQGTEIVIGAQNMHDAEEGAFTGEISANMLKSAGARFVLLGHSERRHLFHESNAFIAKKVKRALQHGLTPILCVGETEGEREKGLTHQVLLSQLTECLKEVADSELPHLILAYEPVWAIGTGKTATPQIAQDAHRACRSFLEKRGGESLARQIPILYGGSVSPATLDALLEERDIDGALVGGASLNIETFSKMMRKS
jgi:triosephosphate isomerase (TIM)